MASAAAIELVEALRRCRLLPPEQLQQVLRRQPRFPTPRALARELLQRDWLTPYQANRLLDGRGDELLLGSHVLLERLGEGGMGQVFKARNWRLGKVVALKVLRKDHLQAPDAVRRPAHVDDPVRSVVVDQVRLPVEQRPQGQPKAQHGEALRLGQQSPEMVEGDGIAGGTGRHQLDERLHLFLTG